MQAVSCSLGGREECPEPLGQPNNSLIRAHDGAAERVLRQVVVVLAHVDHEVAVHAEDDEHLELLGCKRVGCKSKSKSCAIGIPPCQLTLFRPA